MSTALLALALIAYIELKDWNRRQAMAELIELLRKDGR